MKKKSIAKSKSSIVKKKKIVDLSKQKGDDKKKLTTADIEGIDSDLIVGGKDTNPTVETHWPTGIN